MRLPQWIAAVVVALLVAGGATAATVIVLNTVVLRFDAPGATPSVSRAGEARLYFKPDAGAVQLSVNGGAYAALGAGGSTLPSITESDGGVYVAPHTPGALYLSGVQMGAVKTRTVMHGYGDSIMLGTFGITAGHNFMSIVGNRLGISSSTNHGVAGDQAIDTTAVASNLVTTGNMLHLVQVGMNDQRYYAADADKRQIYTDAMRAVLLWLAVPNSEKVAGQSTAQPRAMALSGTWSNLMPGAPWNDNVMVYSNSVNDTATATVNGTTIWVVSLVQTSRTSTFTVSIDGTLTGGTFAISGVNAPVFTTGNGLTFGMRATRFGGLSAGNHTVVQKVTSGGVGQNVYLVFMTGNGWIDVGARPRVIVSNVTRDTTTTVGINDAYNTVVSNLVNEMAADGLDVVLADNKSALNTGSDLNGDGVHPNDTGHFKMADVYMPLAVR